MRSDTELIEAARKAALKAYAPYSNFRVGSSVLTSEGAMFSSANVENAAYPLGSCAEAGAIAAMVVSGARRIETIAVAGGYDELATCTPCGGCRQKLAEFGKGDVKVTMATTHGVEDRKSVV